MKKLLQIISSLSLGVTVVAPVLFYRNILSLDQMKAWILIATILWFSTAPFWMKSGEK